MPRAFGTGAVKNLIHWIKFRHPFQIFGISNGFLLEAVFICPIQNSQPYKPMDITKYFEGIRGQYIEFQITPRIASEDKSEWLKQIEYWKQDSLYLRDTPNIPYSIFDKFLDDGWWLAVNQIDFQTALKLTEALEDIPASQPLVQWIRKHAKEDTYLNVLGV